MACSHPVAITLRCLDCEIKSERQSLEEGRKLLQAEPPGPVRDTIQTVLTFNERRLTGLESVKAKREKP
jgi:hypothetical protein